jgi:hypothetical protein
MLKTLVSLKAGMVSHGYEELVIDEPIEILQDILNSVGSEKPLSVAALEHKMREQQVSDYIVMFLRLLVSYHVQSEKEFFAPFVMVRHSLQCLPYLVCLILATPLCCR